MRNLTIYDLNFYRSQHSNATFSAVARKFGVSPQYVHQLWIKHHPDLPFNQGWALKDIRYCKTCGKEMHVRSKEYARGGGRYCNLKCKYDKTT